MINSFGKLVELYMCAIIENTNTKNAAFLPVLFFVVNRKSSKLNLRLSVLV